MKPKQTCTHENLHFGSGDYYVICSDCYRMWHCEPAESNLSPEQTELTTKQARRVVAQ